jgi:hypothetical protein
VTQLERLEAAGIRMLPAEIGSHYILERDGLVAFVERRENGFGNAGAPGLLTEHGFGALVWRGGQSFFVGKGFEMAATEEQVVRLRAFAADLEKAIASS